MAVRPTNAWFANLMYDTGRLMVAPLPYHVKSTTDGLDVCVPVLNTTEHANAIIAPFVENLSLRSTGGASATQKVTAFTDLGCTVTWSGGMTADLVRGAAYTTMRYTSVTPVVSTIHAITAVNGTGVDNSSTTSFSGTKFKLTLNNGQTWIVYTSSSVTFTISGGQVLTAGAVFTGTVRAAILPADSGAEAVLDSSATCIPTGGNVTLAVSGSTYTKTLTYTTTGTGTLLTYAMPHHQDNLTSPTYAAATVTGLRGSLRGVLGSTWTLTYTAPTIGWDNTNAIDPAKLTSITTALATDEAYVPTVPDPYFGGKYITKAARLACIAHLVGDTAARDQLITNLKPKIQDYFALLVYDTMWGGLVSQVGLTDGGAHFGNGRYNDHHFHYGYAIFAAAVVARFDPSWLTTANKTKINDMVRDIANPAVGSEDPYFTPFRHFDHYEGHSWAGGSPAGVDGRNQESTSEAVNAWWAVQQWGVVSDQPNVTALGKALMTEEIITAKKYWQIKQADNIYPASSFKSKGVVGILWSGKSAYELFFPASQAAIFGIQAIPTNPTTEKLIDPAWAAEVWTNNISTGIYAASEETWKGPLVGIRAQSNPADAWTLVQALTAFDDGTSKTQMLYHVATQVASATPSALSVFGTAAHPGTLVKAVETPIRVATAFYTFSGAAASWRCVGGRLYVPAGVSVPTSCEMSVWEGGATPDLSTTPSRTATLTGIVSGQWNEVQWATALPVTPGTPFWVGYRFADGTYLAVGSQSVAAIKSTATDNLYQAGETEFTMRSRYRYDNGAANTGAGHWGIDCLVDTGA